MGVPRFRRRRTGRLRIPSTRSGITPQCTRSATQRDYFAALDTTPGIQAGIIGWYGNPLAIDTFSTLTCGFQENPAKFCNPGIDAEIGHLAGIEPFNPDGAVDLAAHIDREITDLAPWVPLFNPQSLVLTSARVGNYQSERGALLIDQLWVR